MDYNFGLYRIDMKGFFIKSYHVFQDSTLLYNVKKNGFFSFYNYSIFDTSGHELLRIKRKFAFAKPSFELFQNNQQIATIEKATFANKFQFTSNDFNFMIHGDFLGKEFLAFKGNEEIAKISRKIFKNTGRYGIAIEHNQHHLYIIATTIAIALFQLSKSKN